MTPLQFEHAKAKVWRARRANYEFRVRYEASGGRYPYYAAVCRRLPERGNTHEELLFARFMTLGGAEAWLDHLAHVVVQRPRSE